MHGRVEQTARLNLKMVVPRPDEVRIVQAMMPPRRKQTFLAGAVPFAAALRAGRAGADRHRPGRARGGSASARRRVSRRPGRRALHPRRQADRQSRQHLRPQWRAAGGEHAGGHRVGVPAGSDESGGSDSAARRSAEPRQEVADAAHHQQSGSRVRLPGAPHASERRRAGRGAEDSRRVPAARISALLPGGRSDRPSARLHQEVRRHRPGRPGAGLRPLAGRASRARSASFRIVSAARSRTWKASARRTPAAT